MKKRLFSILLMTIVMLGILFGTQASAFAATSNSETALAIAPKWMKYADDELYISQLSIPGTHDSGTKECSMGQCQGKTIEWQLEHGVRFLDMRLVIGESVDDLRVYHGSFSAKLDFGDVMETVKTFLEENPSECIIMSIKNENGERQQNGKNFDEYLEEKYIENSDWKDLFYTKASIPKLSDVRGKVVLVRRYGYSSLGLNVSSGWTDNGKDITMNRGGYKIRVQDYYSPDTNLPTSSKAKSYAKNEKKPAVEAFDEKAKSGSSSSTLWINFTSGNILGLCTDDVADVMNAYIEERFKDDYLQGVFHGIVAMDWVEDSESQAVFMTNKLEREVEFEIRVNDQTGKTLRGTHTIKLESADGLGKTYDVKSKGDGTYTANIDPREASLKLKIDNKEIDTLSVDTESERLTNASVYQVVYESRYSYIRETELPVDNTVYKSGESVTVSTNTYQAEGGIEFLGWSVDIGSTVKTFNIGTNRYTLTDLWRNPAQSWTDFTTLKSEYYYVNVDTAVTDLRVAENANPVVIVPEGITLICTGTKGNEVFGGRAGIYVPEGASITFVGGGKVYAYGGDADDGNAGLNGGNGTANASGFSGGSGGGGGAGGSGAGAGIGTDGGLKSDRTFTVGYGTKELNKTSYAGKDGINGHNGNAAAAAGTVYNDGVTLVAKGGKAGSGGAGGSAGASATYKDGNNYYTASGGGGGGGGAGGSAGADIGTGGAGGGSGSSGGQGGYVYNSGNGKSAGGDGGKGGYSGSTATTSGADGKNGTSASSNDTSYYNTYAGKSGSVGKGGTATSKSVQSNSPYIKSTVTLDSKKNNTTAATSKGTSSLTVYYGKAYASITLPTLKGYTFGGYWAGRSETNVGGESFYVGTGIQAIDSKGNSKKNHDSFEDMTLYASWQPITYTISYNANGGSGSMSSDTNRSYDVSYRLKANTYTRDGYTFSGWAKSASSTAIAYVDGAKVSNLSSTNGTVVNLYALWTKIPTPSDSEREAAKMEVSSYYDESLYDEDGKSEASIIIANAFEAIDRAETYDELDSAKANAKEHIAAIKTIQQKEEEAEAALAKFKQDAIKELKSYKSLSDYREAEQNTLQALIDEGSDNINAAASEAAAAEALATAKAKMDEVKTSAEIAEAEASQAAALESAKTAAKSELNNYKTLSDYPFEQRRQLSVMISQGCANIDAAESSEAVSEALIAAKAQMDEIKTESEKEEENLKTAQTEAVECLKTFYPLSNYRFAERIVLKKLIDCGIININAAATSAQVEESYAEIEAKIKALKTNLELDAEEVAAAKALQEQSS